MGLKILLDTNAIIALLKNDTELVKIASTSSEIYVSVISELEFKSFSNLSTKDLEIFEVFIRRISVVDLLSSDKTLIRKISEIRKNFRLKLPDAIVAASAIKLNASLISADKEFSKVKELKLFDWQ